LCKWLGIIKIDLHVLSMCMNTCANVSTVESVVLRGKSIERLYGSILWKFV